MLQPTLISPIRSVHVFTCRSNMVFLVVNLNCTDDIQNEQDDNMELCPPWMHHNLSRTHSHTQTQMEQTQLNIHKLIAITFRSQRSFRGKLFARFLVLFFWSILCISFRFVSRGIYCVPTTGKSCKLTSWLVFEFD